MVSGVAFWKVKNTSYFASPRKNWKQFIIRISCTYGTVFFRQQLLGFEAYQQCCTKNCHQKLLPIYIFVITKTVELQKPIH